MGVENFEAAGVDALIDLELSFIGVLQAVSTNGTGWLVPLASFAREDEPELVEDPAVLFGDRGRVTWFKVPPGTLANTMWIVKLRSNVGYDPAANRHDLFAVDGTPSLVQNRIVARFEDEDEARIMVRAGFAVSSPLSGRSFIGVGNQKLVGPLDLETEAGGICRLPTKYEQVSFIKSAGYRFLDLSYKGHQWEFLWPPDMQWASDGKRDWGTDPNVLRRSLALLAKVTPALVSDVALTKQQMTRLSEAIVLTNLQPLEQGQVNRSLKMLKGAEKALPALEHLRDDVLQLPSVRSLLESEKIAAREAGRGEAILNLEAETSLLEQKRKEVASAVKTLEAQGEALRAQVSTQNAFLESTLRDFDDAVAERYRGMQLAPGKALGQLAYLTSLMLPAKTSVHDGKNPNLFRGEASDHMISTRTLTSSAELMPLLEGWAQYCNLPEDILTRVLASWAAGLVPCFYGEDATSAVWALEFALFSDSTYHASLSAGMVSVPQLLSEGEPYSLAKFLGEQSNADTASLVIVEGCNRSLSESSLLPLVRSAMPDASRYAWKPWPASCKLVLTVSASGFTLPIPNELWTYCTLIEVPSRHRALVDNAAPMVPPRRHIQPATIAGTIAPPVVPGAWRGLLERSAPSFQAPERILLKADAFEMVMKSFEPSLDITFQSILESCLINFIKALPEKEINAIAGLVPLESRFRDYLRVASTLNSPKE